MQLSSTIAKLTILKQLLIQNVSQVRTF